MFPLERITSLPCPLLTHIHCILNEQYAVSGCVNKLTLSKKTAQCFDVSAMNIVANCGDHAMHFSLFFTHLCLLFFLEPDADL